MTEASAQKGVVSFDTQHSDMIHDSQVDYYGKRLATCSSDRTVKIFNLVDGEVAPQQTATIQAHDGPVWQIAWAHPKFGSLLASCGFDGKVCVWKESASGNWTSVHQYTGHSSSVNSISFAPHELDLKLLCGSADGSISVLSLGQDNQTWTPDRKGALEKAHQIGVNAVSWAPALSPGDLAMVSQPRLQQRFVSGGCDGTVKVWSFEPSSNSWVVQHTLAEHTDWVRDVAWAPNAGLPYSIVASCSQDKSVIIWTQGSEREEWKSTKLTGFSGPVWRVSWSLSGYVLAVTSGDGAVSLWKQAADGEWRCIDRVGEGSGN